MSVSRGVGGAAGWWNFPSVTEERETETEPWLLHTVPDTRPVPTLPQPATVPDTRPVPTPPQPATVPDTRPGYYIALFTLPQPPALCPHPAVTVPGTRPLLCPPPPALCPIVCPQTPGSERRTGAVSSTSGRALLWSLLRGCLSPSSALPAMANYIHVPPGSPEVPRVELTVLESGYQEGAIRLLRELRPDWKTEEVTTQMFTDGITNKLIGCYVGDAMDDVVLVRVYGNKTELLVDRDEELKSFRVLQAHGCAPKLYCTFNNGLCYEFMQGAALDPEHVCNPTIFILIARQLAKIHAIHAHNGWIPKSNLWYKMKKYFSLIPREFPDQPTHDRFVRDVPSPQVLEQEMAWMKSILSSLASPVVLCHNDLLCKNIIYNESKGDVQFIDYEYSGYNYQAYDIGNHFNEFAGVNEVDYSLYPGRALQVQWLRAYLEAYKEYKGFTADVSEKEVERLYVQVNQFALASHFFWGLWALIQAKYSKIDFDFLGYAVVRLNQYFKIKPEVMALALPE